MPKTYELNRLANSGPIDDETPTCVLLTIVACHGGLIEGEVDTPEKISSLISALRSLRVEKIKISDSGEISSRKLPYLARFINPEQLRWTSSELIPAFLHLRNFTSSGAPELPVGTWTFGPKTPSEPLRFDCVMLYSILRYYGIRTSRKLELRELAESVRSLSLGPERLRAELLRDLNFLPLARLVEIRSLISSGAQLPSSSAPIEAGVVPRSIARAVLPPSEVRAPTLDELQDCHRRLTTSKNLISRILPETATEAIVIAGLFMSIDIGDSDDPLTEYLELRANFSSGGYLPVDANFRRQYLVNPDWFHLERNWSPRFPWAYTEEALLGFASNEGYSFQETRRELPGNLMHLSRVSPTFHPGRHPRARPLQDQTLISQEPISELDPDSCLSYGVSEDPKSIWITSLEDLSSHFDAQKAFRNPLEVSELFSDVSINKLKLYLERRLAASRSGSGLRRSPEGLRPGLSSSSSSSAPRVVGRGVSPRVSSEMRRLLEVIEQIESRNKTKLQEARDLAARYDGSGPELRAQILNWLTQLLELGMYMRGWKVGSSSYPLSADATRTSPSKQNLVELRVTEALGEFESLSEQIPPDTSLLLKRLPLLKTLQSEGRTVFQPSSSLEDEGLTIWDRVRIVKGGAITDNIHSCIRTSSNVFICSAYYYLTALGQTLNFQISELRHIS